MPSLNQLKSTMSQNKTTNWKRVQVSKIDEIERVSGEVVALMTDAGFSDKDKFSMRLALEEAIVNAIRHGNQEDPGKHVRVAYRVSDDEAVAEIEDQGNGFDPSALPDPLDPDNLEKPTGRGVFLMRVYMTWIKFNDRGNSVTLCRNKSEASPTEASNN